MRGAVVATEGTVMEVVSLLVRGVHVSLSGGEVTAGRSIPVCLSGELPVHPALTSKSALRHVDADEVGGLDEAFG
jgi:hypothetical protein